MSNGRGTFFNNSRIPFPSSGRLTCIYGTTCVKDTYEPSINLTTRGVLAVAYTAYTNDSPCANVSRYAQSEIGFSRSLNSGSNWSVPIYIGNRDCTVANQYASSWEPSLTSLGNGTLVLAFIAYNFSSASNYLPAVQFGPTSWNIRSAALMLTESYDGGTTWTSPILLNASKNALLNANGFTPERPSITAYGNTLYVTWMNYSEEPSFICCYRAVGSAQVHLLVSMDGGTTWHHMINVTNVVARSNLSIGTNPAVIVDSSGDLYIAYDTNWTFWLAYPVGCTSLCYHDTYTLDIELAKSSTNGSALVYSTISRQMMYVANHIGSMSAMLDPAPHLAFGERWAQLYASWSATRVDSTCTYCFSSDDAAAYIANSSDLGQTWSNAHMVKGSLNGSGGQIEYNPALAVTSDGTVHFELSYVNLSTASCTPYSYTCPEWELYLNSTDNGTTFSDPITIDSNATGSPTAPDGLYCSMVSAGSFVWFSWAHESLAAPATTYVYFPDSRLSVQVMVSQIYHGTGLNLTFQENRLKAGTPWTVNLLGNIRGGSAPGSISITGVPPGASLTWSVPTILSGYGDRYVPNSSLGQPTTIVVPTTVYENFTQQFLVDVRSTPDIPTCGGVSYSQFCWDDPNEAHETYLLTPGPAPDWINANSTLVESATQIAFYCVYYYCYDEFLNLTFLSWTGSGAGSVNSNGTSVSLTARGPINETANFQVNAVCRYFSYYSPPLTCTTLNQSLVFHETGLPSGVNWTATVWGENGVTTTRSSNTSWLTIASAATLGVVTYVTWTIPTGSPGQYWIGTGTPSSPVLLPEDRVINVTFTKGVPASSDFYASFQPYGLPNETAWTLSLGTNSYGTESGAYTTTLAGGTHKVGGSPVYLDNGSGFYLSGVDMETFVENQTSSWTNGTSVPASLVMDGPAMVVLSYSPEYWATVVAEIGGTVTPASQWVHSGAALALNATPLPGYTFVGWTGIGSGSVTSRSLDPVAHPTGSITELATFQLVPPPRWTVRVSANGLPFGTNFTATIGDHASSGSGTLSVTGLPTGTYPVSFEYVYDNASNSTRYVPTGWTSSFSSPGSGEIAVGSNGTVSVAFETQYLMTVMSTGSGAVAPASGVGWWDEASSVTLTATPDPHYQLAGWFGTGTGSVTSTNHQQLAITPTINGPVTETAQFIWKPTSTPETFNLTVTASGLATGLEWTVSAGETGVQGSSTSLTIPGLNGSYNVTVAPIVVSAGERFVSNSNGTYNVSVSGNSALSVSFTEQYYVLIQNATGGRVTPLSGWYDAGATVALSATPTSSKWHFVEWAGIGSGNYTGSLSSPSITVDAPMIELATFEPVNGTSTPLGSVIAIVLFSALLVVGLLFGWRYGRMAPPRGREPAAARPPS